MNESTRGPERRSGIEGVDGDLDPSIRGAERRELLSFAQRLIQERPTPRPGLRSAIRSRLLSGRRHPSERSRLAGLIFGYTASGALLLLVAAVGIVGIGPFAT